MKEKKLVLPGDYIAAAEEMIPGENTYSEDDSVYSCVIGELTENERQADVELKRQVPEPEIGMELYCVVRKISATKAFLDCVPASSLEHRGSVNELSAVLPVQNIKREHVREVKDEVRTGDVIKARISKVQRGDFDVSIQDRNHGVVAAFCSVCRKKMLLKDKVLICNDCEREERRKLSDEYPGA